MADIKKKKIKKVLSEPIYCESNEVIEIIDVPSNSFARLDVMTLNGQLYSQNINSVDDLESGEFFHDTQNNSVFVKIL